MNWRTKRRLLLGGAVLATLAPLLWLGGVAWDMHGMRRSIATGQTEVAEMLAELADSDGSALVDPEGIGLPAPGVETQPVGDALLDTVELAEHENVAEFLGSLERMAVDLGLEVFAADFVPSATQGRTAYEVRVHGTAEQVCHFVSAIELLREISIVEALHLVGRDDGTVEARIGVARFHQEEKR